MLNSKDRYLLEELGGGGAGPWNTEWLRTCCTTVPPPSIKLHQAVGGNSYWQQSHHRQMCPRQGHRCHTAHACHCQASPSRGTSLHHFSEPHAQDADRIAVHLISSPWESCLHYPIAGMREAWSMGGKMLSAGWPLNWWLLRHCKTVSADTHTAPATRAQRAQSPSPTTQRLLPSCSAHPPPVPQQSVRGAAVLIGDAVANLMAHVEVHFIGHPQC